MNKRPFILILLPLFLTANEPKTFTPYDVNVTPSIQIVNRQNKPIAENGYYQSHYYYQTDDYGSAIAVFGLGHLFNFSRVMEEYKSYFRPDPPRSSRYQYEFEYAESINKK